MGLSGKGKRGYLLSSGSHKTRTIQVSIEYQAEAWAALTIGKRTREEFLTRHELYRAQFRASLTYTATTLLPSLSELKVNTTHGTYWREADIPIIINLQVSRIIKDVNAG